MSDTETTAAIALRVVSALARAQMVGDYDVLGDPTFALCEFGDVQQLLTASDYMCRLAALQYEYEQSRSATAYRNAANAFCALSMRMRRENNERITRESADE